MDNYLRGTIIGTGVSGKVYKSEDLRTGHVHAIKRMVLEGGESSIVCLREISLLSILKHPNVMRLYEVVYEMSHVNLVLDYMDYDLCDFINVMKPEQFFTIMEVKFITFQLLNGTAYCHKMGIIHRDLKPQNVLMKNNGHVKIADFGLAKYCDVPLRTYSHQVVTLWYRAPELLLELSYTFSVDLWSIGCIICEMVMKKVLFLGDDEAEVLHKIYSMLSTPSSEISPDLISMEGYINTFPKFSKNVLQARVRSTDADCVHLFQSLLVYDPKQRISAQEALKSKFITEIYN